MIKAMGKLRRSRFAKDEGGVAAIEFAILALPFMMTIFAVVETSVSFTAQQVMSNATDRIARDLRTGQLDPTTLNAAQFRNLVCGELDVMMPSGCPDLYVDVQEYPSYAAVPKDVPYSSAGVIDRGAFGYSPGGRGTINSMRLLYEWPVYTDILKSYLSNLQSGKTLIYSTHTWRNEP